MTGGNHPYQMLKLKEGTQLSKLRDIPEPKIKKSKCYGKESFDFI